MTIRRLDEGTINRIAAGEVVERAAVRQRDDLGLGHPSRRPRPDGPAPPPPAAPAEGGAGRRHLLPRNLHKNSRYAIQIGDAESAEGVGRPPLAASAESWAAAAPIHR